MPQSYAPRVSLMTLKLSLLPYSASLALLVVVPDTSNRPSLTEFSHLGITFPLGTIHPIATITGGTLLLEMFAIHMTIRLRLHAIIDDRRLRLLGTRSRPPHHPQRGPYGITTM